MEENKEISALFHLIDDPDEEVFTTVKRPDHQLWQGNYTQSRKSLGNTPAEDVQERIESLIHRLHYKELHFDFQEWSRKEYQDLIEGALLVSRLNTLTSILHPLSRKLKIQRNIWLELNSYLTALEQINVVNKILFSYHKFKGVEISYQHQEEFLMNKVIETKRGNSITHGIIYQYLCQMLDIPVKAVNIPRQYILAYFDTSHDYSAHRPRNIKSIFI